jgi:hypothetical protein
VPEQFLVSIIRKKKSVLCITYLALYSLCTSSHIIYIFITLLKKIAARTVCTAPRFIRKFVTGAVYVALCLLPFSAVAQKTIRTYHDPEKQKLKEEYVVGDDNETMMGSYKNYYENGNLMMQGNFEDGKKSGVFTEFHENGTPARKLNYVNGIRHGAVQVFNEEESQYRKRSIRMIFSWIVFNYFLMMALLKAKLILLKANLKGW